MKICNVRLPCSARTSGRCAGRFADLLAAETALRGRIRLEARKRDRRPAVDARTVGPGRDAGFDRDNVPQLGGIACHFRVGNVGQQHGHELLLAVRGAGQEVGVTLASLMRASPRCINSCSSLCARPASGRGCRARLSSTKSKRRSLGQRRRTAVQRGEPHGSGLERSHDWGGRRRAAQGFRSSVGRRPRLSMATHGYSGL